MAVQRSPVVWPAKILFALIVTFGHTITIERRPRSLVTTTWKTRYAKSPTLCFPVSVVSRLQNEQSLFNFSSTVRFSSVAFQIDWMTRDARVTRRGCVLFFSLEARSRLHGGEVGDYARRTCVRNCAKGHRARVARVKFIYATFYLAG